jgi:hypothetical protein
VEILVEMLCFAARAGRLRKMSKSIFFALEVHQNRKTALPAIIVTSESSQENGRVTAAILRKTKGADRSDL